MLLLAAVSGCERRAPPDPRVQVSRALTGMLVYPRSQPVSMAAGDQAAQLTMTTTDSLSKVADWFRQVFQLNHWTLESDVANPDGSVSIMATKDDRPIWLSLHRNAGAEGTTYTLIGAIPADSAAVAESLARAKTRPPVPARKPGQVR
jgi:hypothetical protein